MLSWLYREEEVAGVANVTQHDFRGLVAGFRRSSARIAAAAAAICPAECRQSGATPRNHRLPWRETKNCK